MTIETITQELLAKKLLEGFDSRQFIEWAINALKLGHETELLVILAGLDFDATEEREKYFQKSINELGLKIDFSKDELLHKYALNIASKVILKKIDINDAFEKMLKIVSATEYDSRYIAFFLIDEDLSYLKYENFALFNSEIASYKDYIFEEFQIFLSMEHLGIPIEERKKYCFCKICNELTLPILKNKIQFKIPFRYLAWTCNQCGSRDILLDNNQTVKKMVIKKYKSKLNHN